MSSTPTRSSGAAPPRSGWSALAADVRRPLILTVHELDTRPRALTACPRRGRADKWRFNRSVFLHPAGRGGGWSTRRTARLHSWTGAPPDRVTYRPLPGPPPPPSLPDPRPSAAVAPAGREAGAGDPDAVPRPPQGLDLALASAQGPSGGRVLVAAGGEHAADRTGTEAWLRDEAARAGLADRVRVTGYLTEDLLEKATCPGGRSPGPVPRDAAPRLRSTSPGAGAKR